MNLRRKAYGGRCWHFSRSTNRDKTWLPHISTFSSDLTITQLFLDVTNEWLGETERLLAGGGWTSIFSRYRWRSGKNKESTPSNWTSRLAVSYLPTELVTSDRFLFDWVQREGVGRHLSMKIEWLWSVWRFIHRFTYIYIFIIKKCRGELSQNERRTEGVWLSTAFTGADAHAVFLMFSRRFAHAKSWGSEGEKFINFFMNTRWTWVIVFVPTRQTHFDLASPLTCSLAHDTPESTLARSSQGILLRSLRSFTATRPISRRRERSSPQGRTDFVH